MEQERREGAAATIPISNRKEHKRRELAGFPTTLLLLEFCFVRRTVGYIDLRARLWSYGLPYGLRNDPARQV
jgi:hypothetical protein